MVRYVFLVGLALSWVMGACGAELVRREWVVEGVRREWVVEGVRREALVHVPAKAGAKEGHAPVIFAFHGHGGTMQFAARSFALHEVWPEALVVYPQGLNTPGRLTDREGKKPGWQAGPGLQSDRDLKFFDAMLASLKADSKMDAKRVYSTGHSNGGSFTYLLWAMRGDQIAACAPSGSAAPSLLGQLKPKPLLHVAGENDPLVKYAWQRATIEALLKINQCEKGRAWDADKNCTYYASAIGAPVVTAIHPGGHEYPKDAPEVIVKFFKSLAKTP